MKTKVILLLLVMFGLISPAFAGSADMTYQCWDPGCEHTMTTNHFDLAPGEMVEVPIDLTSCGEAREGILFFGYHTTKNSSRQFTARDRIRITVIDETTGQEWSSDSGSLYVADARPTVCRMYAENMNQKKSIKVRLRSQVIW